MAQMDISEENFVKLNQIQYVVNFEDGMEANLDEVLARVLEFYRKFVPYN
jgi:hypothetical protein